MHSHEIHLFFALLSGISAARRGSISENIAKNDDADFLTFYSKFNKSYTIALEYDWRKSKSKDSDTKVFALNSINLAARFDLNFTSNLEDIKFNKILGGQIPSVD